MAKRLNPEYSEYHPKWYRRRMPIFWWLRSVAYARFIARELTSLAVAYAALLLLALTWSLGRGEAAYDEFVAFLRLRPVIAFHFLILAALLFHTVTWLNLAPKALVVRLGRRRAPDALVVLAHYSAWLAVSGLVAWLLLGR
jgi:fumarate reductase subunit C